MNPRVGFDAQIPSRILLCSFCYCLHFLCPRYFPFSLNSASDLDSFYSLVDIKACGWCLPFETYTTTLPHSAPHLSRFFPVRQNRIFTVYLSTSLFELQAQALNLSIPRSLLVRFTDSSRPAGDLRIATKRHRSKNALFRPDYGHGRTDFGNILERTSSGLQDRYQRLVTPGSQKLNGLTLCRSD